ncbi:hypothetical protein [Christiangramia salexigens]|uniref:PRC-barrel domain-containing protein n=1 Tax=Christiangramia salexigens TaxID=1913577 RepID=A0A1L3J3P2_9FLAO|nr:hypothetical protein [Christiangramia salexigens]APG59749.1 hypothetical protein LPB144_04665 [Christiangramia salexigens]
MSAIKKHLYYLKELKNYKVLSSDDDIRGWKVKDLDNRTIGTIDDLLVNKDLGKVVYVDVLVDQSIIDSAHDPFEPSQTSGLREFINKDGENHIIIPIGLISLNKKEKFIFTESINYNTFAATRRFKTGESISREYEDHILRSYKRSPTPNGLSNSDKTETEILEQKWQMDHMDEVAREDSEDIQLDSGQSEREKQFNKAKMDRSIEAKRNAELQRELHPEDDKDDDPDWDYENPRPGDDDPYRHRRRTNKEKEDAYYDRQEFKTREL